MYARAATCTPASGMRQQLQAILIIGPLTQGTVKINKRTIPMTRFQASAVLLQSHPQVSLHSAIARTSQSVPFTSALPRAVLSPGGQY